MFSCPHCSRNFSNPGGLGSHAPYCKLNPNRTQRVVSTNAGVKKGNVPWNAGLRGDTRCARPAQQGKRFAASLNGHSAETKQKLSLIAKARNLGGPTKGSGVGRKGWYKGYWCDSSYELAWVVYQLDHGVPFERNNIKFDYTFNGELKKWLPDFVLADGSYIEIKGYVNDNVHAKLASFPHPIELLTRERLNAEFNYVINTYGKDFTKLYG